MAAASRRRSGRRRPGETLDHQQPRPTSLKTPSPTHMNTCSTTAQIPYPSHLNACRTVAPTTTNPHGDPSAHVPRLIAIHYSMILILISAGIGRILGTVRRGSSPSASSPTTWRTTSGSVVRPVASVLHRPARARRSGPPVPPQAVGHAPGAARLSLRPPLPQRLHGRVHRNGNLGAPRPRRARPHTRGPHHLAPQAHPHTPIQPADAPAAHGSPAGDHAAASRGAPRPPFQPRSSSQSLGLRHCGRWFLGRALFQLAMHCRHHQAWRRALDNGPLQDFGTHSTLDVCRPLLLHHRKWDLAATDKCRSATAYGGGCQIAKANVGDDNG